MKKNVLLSAAALCFAALSAFASPGAQDKVSLTLPHEVTVDRTVLPAGDYTFERMSSNGNVLLIYSVRESKPVGLFVCNPASEATPSNRTEAVLKHLGDRYYIEEIRIAGQIGLQLPMASAEK